MKKTILHVLYIFILVICYTSYAREAKSEESIFRIGIVGISSTEDTFSQLYFNLHFAETILPVTILEGRWDIPETESVRELIGQEIDGLMLFTSDEKILPTVCGICEEAKVHWGVFLWQIQDDDIRSLCESSEYYIGNTGEMEEQTGSEALRKAYDMGFRKTVLFSEERWNVTCMQREKGISDALKDCPGMEILHTVRAIQGWQDAETLTETLIAAYPEMDSILIAGTKGSNVPDGVIAGIRNAEKEKNIRLFSIDLPINVEECFSTGILAAAYGLPSLSLDPLFLFYALLNHVEGNPLSEQPQSYFLKGVLVDHTGQREKLVSFLSDPKQLLLDEDQIHVLCKKENPSLDEKGFQQFITEYLDSF